MSTIPNEPGGMPGTWGGARMPIPGNAEFAVYFLDRKSVG